MPYVAFHHAVLNSHHHWGISDRASSLHMLSRRPRVPGKSGLRLKLLFDMMRALYGCHFLPRRTYISASSTAITIRTSVLKSQRIKFTPFLTNFAASLPEQNKSRGSDRGKYFGHSYHRRKKHDDEKCGKDKEHEREEQLYRGLGSRLFRPLHPYFPE